MSVEGRDQNRDSTSKSSALNALWEDHVYLREASVRPHHRLKSDAFYLVIRAATRSTSFHARISRVESCRSARLLGDLLFQAWQTFSVKINILRVRGPLASVSTLVGVQKVHGEPVSGRQ